ncbi:glycosyltransferase family 39 protein [Dokdonella sp.]|uniref:glycosyltransferase family 39 protein n=1 Tax=Dokdonella sp. TaxID=2291710 RepID=UPI00321F8AB0
MSWTLPRQNLAIAGCLVLLTGLVSFAVRPLLPVDETRYISVAWEMWSQGTWWLPTRNFEQYAHKPPLFFWLIHLGWAAFGVNEWWPRLLNPMLAVANLGLIARLARALWPANPTAEANAPLVYMASWVTLTFTTTLMFDTLMTACVLLAAWGLVRADRGSPDGWSLLALGVALGLLTKGPVVFVYVLPVALAHRYWTARTGQGWYRFLVPCVLVASLPVLIWVYAVAQATGSGHLQELLVDQTMARVSGDIGHGRPFWWYLPWLLLIATPWLFWPAFWRGLRRLPGPALADRGLRFVAIATTNATVILSLVGGKQVHYLLPIWAIAAPGLAFLLAQAAVRESDVRIMWVPYAIPLALVWLPVSDPDIHADLVAIRPALTVCLLAVGALLYLARQLSVTRMLAIASTGLMMTLFVCVFAALRPRYGLERAAQFVSKAQIAGRTVAYVGYYQAEFGFLGRLTQPVASIEVAQIDQWARDNPNGLLVGRSKRLKVADAAVVYRQAYRSDELLMVDSSSITVSAPAEPRIDPLVQP